MATMTTETNVIQFPGSDRIIEIDNIVVQWLNDHMDEHDAWEALSKLGLSDNECSEILNPDFHDNGELTA